MKNLIIALILVVGCTACATVFNLPKTSVTIYTEKPAVMLLGEDTIPTRRNQASLSVPRSGKDLNFSVAIDSQIITHTEKARLSSMFFANIFCNYGLGLLVDVQNDKRYTYPRHLYLHGTSFSRYKPWYQKKNLYWVLSFPYINYFKFHPTGENIRRNAGFMGIGTGVDYYLAPKQFIRVIGRLALNFPIPAPAPIDFSGEVEKSFSEYLSIARFHHWRRYAFGYGLAGGLNRWQFVYYDAFEPPPPTRPEANRSYGALGLELSAYRFSNKQFTVGLVYRPTFWQIDKTVRSRREALLSLDLAWRIKLK